MALSGRVDRTTVKRTDDAPHRVVDIARLEQCRQSLRVGHRGEVAVVGGADPARARRIGAVVRGAHVASERAVGRDGLVLLEAVAGLRETFPVERRIGIGAHAEAMFGESRLMGVDEAHTLARLVVAEDPGPAGRQRLHCW